MKFPWDRYEPCNVNQRPTMQIYITNKCNLQCDGCFARFAADRKAEGDAYMSMSEYTLAVAEARNKGAKQINLLGGEPLLHSKIDSMCSHNFDKGLKTTIYTNGLLLGNKPPGMFHGAKLRVSVDCLRGGTKSFENIFMPVNNYIGEVDINYMVIGTTTLNEMLRVANEAEDIGCKTFFISSYRYLGNNTDFFEEDSGHTFPTPSIRSGQWGSGVQWVPPKAMPMMRYKELVHAFLYAYADCKGGMDIHISKRGVFESVSPDSIQYTPLRKCNFVNYFIGGKVIQCPYDVVNLKYVDDYKFGERYCQQNSTCLMSKIVVRPKLLK